MSFRLLDVLQPLGWDVNDTAEDSVIGKFFVAHDVRGVLAVRAPVGVVNDRAVLVRTEHEERMTGYIFVLRIFSGLALYVGASRQALEEAFQLFGTAEFDTRAFSSVSHIANANIP